MIATIAFRGFPGGTRGKEPTCQCRRLRDVGVIPAQEESPGGQHSTLLAWEISWTDEPDGLQSMGSSSVGHY